MTTMNDLTFAERLLAAALIKERTLEFGLQTQDMADACATVARDTFTELAAAPQPAVARITQHPTGHYRTIIAADET